MGEFVERPTEEQIKNAVFTASDGSFDITVAEADHALRHYNEMVGLCAKDAAPEDSRRGLMAACLAHALGWTEKQGLRALLTNEPFRAIIILMQDCYNDCKAQGLYDSPEARLS